MPDSLDPRALDEVLAMAGGDREFVVAVVDEYLADSAATVASLLAAICQEIERAAKDGPVDAPLIAAAEAEHASARAALELHVEGM